MDEPSWLIAIVLVLVFLASVEGGWRVPPPVVWTLVIVAVFAAASTGYGLAAAGHRHRLASSGLFISVALIMTLIFELDEPRTGLIRVPQAPMERVASAILGAPPPN